jgi:hypothetical protein
MESKLILSKNSSENEIKRYFKAVLKLSQSDNEFPINFDEVWMLVYQDKHKAVEDLKDKFIQDVDYKALTQKVECSNGIGYSRRIDYFLTVSCMEFFIARKVRPVFEVYRKVFHKSAEQTLSLSDKMKAASWAAKFLNLNDSSKLLMAKQILDPLGLPTPDYTESKDQLLSATELLGINGLKISAQTFNARMAAKGLLTTLQRQSSKGIKKFKSLTADGLKYGENQVNPNNPKETQPLYYAHLFSGLLSDIGL